MNCIFCSLFISRDIARMQIIRYKYTHILLVIMNVTESRTEQIQPTKERILHPTKTYTREQFYETTEDVRYMLKFSLINGQQASDINIGIEDLVDFMGDVEKLIVTEDDLSVKHRDHTHWTVKMNTGDNTMITNIDSRSLESSIENIAEKHGIALKKEISLSGRGYDRKGSRLVSVSYSFGTYREDDEEWIKNPNNPRTNVKWVGGSIGEKKDLNESTVEIGEVKTLTGFERLVYKIKKKLWFI